MSLLHGVGSGLGGSGDAGGPLGSFYSQTIDQSLRLNAADSAHLTFTQGTATDISKWTVNFWLKRADPLDDSSDYDAVFGVDGPGTTGLAFLSGKLYLFINYDTGGSQARLITNRVFRDPSAWYNFHITFDRANGTAAQRLRLYVNGVEETSFSTDERSNITSSSSSGWNVSGLTAAINRRSGASDSRYHSGYLAQFYNIDGAVVAPTEFAETKDGVWIPKAYSGSYGNNGWLLPFANAESSGASAFFLDSGNSYVQFTDANHYDIGSSDDFTIEFFINFTTAGAADYSYVFGNYEGTSGPYLSIQYSNSANAFYFYYGNGQAFTFTFSSGDIVAGKWHHVAINRASGNLDAFLDGTRLGGNQTSNSTSWNQNNVRIGMGQSNGTNSVDGYISNVRMVVGSAVYSSGSSITVPTSTLTAVTNTQLLALTTSTMTADASSNNVTGTLSGSGYFGTSGYSPFANFNFHDDQSGNANNFVANNVFPHDVVPDSPTNNFATMNPLFPGNNASLGEGNLDVTPGGFTSSKYGTTSTFAIPKDKKIYLEVECTDQAGNYWTAGFATATSLFNGPGSNNIGSSGAIMMYNRSVQINGSENDYGSSAGIGGLGVSKFSAGDILGMAIDGATGKVWFSRNGTYFGAPQGHQSGAGATGDPAAGTNEIGTITGGTTDDVFVVVSGNAGISVFVNFGQDSQNVASANADSEGIGTFEYAVPTDYVCLCAANLTTPAIGPTESSQADDHFNTVLYTGNASSRSITGVGFQPDWVWLKPRSDADNHVFFDSVRGVQNFLYANLGNSQATRSGDGLSSFDSDGFSIGDWNNINESSQTYVAWNWKAGGAPTADNSAAANAEPTAGSAKIDGSNQSGAFSGSPSIAIKRLSASTTAGVSIVRWTGTGSAGTIPHGLGAAPEFYTVKNLTDSSTNWQSYHRGIASDAETDYIYLNSTAAAGDADDWNDTAPTANVFSVKTHNQVNASGDDYISYLFTPIEGYSKFGSYVGNSDSDGTFVFTGFRPAWVLIKSTSSGTSWCIFDNKREGYNVDNDLLRVAAATEQTDDDVDFVSNGLKFRRSSTNFNNSSHTYIYLAFADDPFKFANAR